MTLSKHSFYANHRANLGLLTFHPDQPDLFGLPVELHPIPALYVLNLGIKQKSKSFRNRSYSTGRPRFTRNSPSGAL
jgi:hypothetical protein